MKMFKLSSLLAAVASLAAATALAAPVNKCIVNGTVTYQQEPCPTGQVRKPPTVQELNAEEKKRREAAAAATPPKPTLAGPTEPAGTPEKIAPATRAATSRYQCDGRTYCSQMTSCAEAKFFLANCPGVKMDGDRDGIPCEEQWCGH
ncbi:MAG TPA: excalibur calcium-binding domain-containing protein [Burkholderiaceae bacterium]|nr:excalibur calcium-binding domain-containing protein [Burkholderiaceae bacterium]HRZ01252.1 excalibur calcium-binding domain-containing protein [Burkholderiaceae bacterium]